MGALLSSLRMPWASTTAVAARTAHGTRITCALRKLGDSRATLDARVGVLERKINDVDARLREVHIARDARAVYQRTMEQSQRRQLTSTERRRVKHLLTQRRLYETALAQLDAMVTNNEAVVLQLQNSQVVTQAVDALSAGAEAGRVHERNLRRLDVDALLDQLAEQQASLDDVVVAIGNASSGGSGGIADDDDAELERELDNLVREQEEDRTFDSNTIMNVRIAALAAERDGRPRNPDEDLCIAAERRILRQQVAPAVTTVGIEELEPLILLAS